MARTYLTQTEASQYLSISKTTLWRWIKAGRLPRGETFGGRTPFWTKTQLDSFVLSQKNSQSRPELLMA